MNSLERVKLALNHKEPDRVPFDLGGTVVTGIHVQAYKNLRAFLGLPEKEIDIVHLSQQLARVDQDVMAYLGVDVSNVAPQAIERFDVTIHATDEYLQFYDEYGIGWRMPRDGGTDSAELKREFGANLPFWGGGVDTQTTFDRRATPDQVREDVRRRLDDLMPGVGFVFNPVHNIQGNVPPENIIAMWETVQEFGIY